MTHSREPLAHKKDGTEPRTHELPEEETPPRIAVSILLPVGTAFPTGLACTLRLIGKAAACLLRTLLFLGKIGTATLLLGTLRLSFCHKNKGEKIKVVCIH